MILFTDEFTLPMNLPMNLLNKVERDSVLKNNAEVRGPRSEVQGGVSECECESESQFESESAQERTQTHIHIHTSSFRASDEQR